MNGSGALLIDGRYEFPKRVVGRIPVECLSASVAHPIRYGVQRLLLMRDQVHAPGHDLAR